MSKTMGVGIDAVSIRRIQNILNEYPEKFSKYAFTKSEREYCNEKPCSPQHYAARWAVKEAFIKSVSESEINPDLKSIEVVNKPAPQLSLSEPLENTLINNTSPDRLSNNDIDTAVSITHEKEIDAAIGIVIILFPSPL